MESFAKSNCNKKKEMDTMYATLSSAQSLDSIADITMKATIRKECVFIVCLFLNFNSFFHRQFPTSSFGLDDGLVKTE